MISHRTRRGFIDRLGATTLVAAAVVCSIGFGATCASAADAASQPR
ncbi:hypothetical protein JOE53_001491 [Microbacterium laevaniformans]|nr:MULTISPECIES: hypothetical protein [Microbacterium]MBM7752771.1 hypothetical protein [Microbacterium laevaniformans]GLJ65707.1 hypothetical protein GCM10017578_25960 [Microbacterium laevaniformans]